MTILSVFIGNSRFCILHSKSVSKKIENTLYSDCRYTMIRFCLTGFITQKKKNKINKFNKQKT